MLVYTTTTGQDPIDPAGYAGVPLDVSDFDPHSMCVHSIGYCADGDWD